MIKSESEQPINNVVQNSKGSRRKGKETTIESGLVNPITRKRQTNKQVTQEGRVTRNSKPVWRKTNTTRDSKFE